MAGPKEDSGWVPLFNGTDLKGFYTFFENMGMVDTARQDAFKVENGKLHVPKPSTVVLTLSQGRLTTLKEYSWYRVRVDYRFGPGSGSENAGLVFHIENSVGRDGRFKDRRDAGP